ncbi:cytochrome c, partial [Deinococcus sp.]|uniref:cytochrome c n=1 Tax=Deinococcus sp. TaxID=47478 RepID=UPI00286989A7
MNRLPLRSAGDVLSWALGVTGGVILGAALLIGTPLMMRKPASATATTPKAEATASTPSAPAATTAPAAATEAPKDTMADAPAAAAPTAAATSAGGTGDTKAGATVFASNCAGCHGAEAKGGVGANLTTADGPKAWTDAQMITALR